MFAATIMAAAAVGGPMLQSRWQHRREINASELQYEMEVLQANQQHKDGLDQSVRFNGESRNASLRLFAEEMGLELDVARRETLRDIWTQRSEHNQTMLSMAALMLSCAFENFSQTTLPAAGQARQMDLWLLYCLNIFLGLGALSCVVSILCCFTVRERLTWYNTLNAGTTYYCGKKHPHINSYFDCHCEGPRSASVIFFDVGSVLVVLAAIALQSVKFISYWDDFPSVYIFAISAGIGLPVLVVGPIFWPARGMQMKRTRSDYGGAGATTREQVNVERIVFGNAQSPSRRNKNQQGNSSDVEDDGAPSEYSTSTRPTTAGGGTTTMDRDQTTSASFDFRRRSVDGPPIPQGSGFFSVDGMNADAAAGADEGNDEEYLTTDEDDNDENDMLGASTNYAGGDDGLASSRKEGTGIFEALDSMNAFHSVNSSDRTMIGSRNQSGDESTNRFERSQRRFS